MKTVIVDFEDSFTFNICSHLEWLGCRPQVIHYKELNWNTPESDWLVLGPGPGHPDEYLETIEVLKDVLHKGEVRLGGICLGHQLICRALGMKVERCLEPRHGQMVDFTVPEWEIFSPEVRNKTVKVQRYNSLSVVCNKHDSRNLDEKHIQYTFDEEGRICALYCPEKILSYQFHPESVGTADPRLFLSPFTV